MFGNKSREFKGISLKDIPIFNPNQTETEDNSIFAIGLDKTGKLVRRGLPGFGGSSGEPQAQSLNDVVNVGEVVSNGNSTFAIHKYAQGGINIAGYFEGFSMFETSIGEISFTKTSQVLSNTSLFTNYKQTIRTTNFESELISEEVGGSWSLNYNKVVVNYDGVLQIYASILGNKSTIVNSNGFGINTNTNNLWGYIKSDYLNLSDQYYQLPVESGTFLVDSRVVIRDEADPNKSIRVRLMSDDVLRFNHPDNNVNGILNIAVMNDIATLSVVSRNNTAGFSIGVDGTDFMPNVTIPDILFGRIGVFRKSAAPINSSSSGKIGEMKADSSWLYICTAPNTWRRVALSTF